MRIRRIILLTAILIVFICVCVRGIKAQRCMEYYREHIMMDEQGLRAYYYDNPEWKDDPVYSCVEREVYFKDIDDLSTKKTGGIFFSINWHGLLTIPVSGRYKFKIISDDGSRLYFNGVPIVKNDGIHPEKEVSVRKYIRKGVYPIEIRYFQAGGDAVMSLLWRPPKPLRNLKGQIPPTFLRPVNLEFSQTVAYGLKKNVRRWDLLAKISIIILTLCIVNFLCDVGAIVVTIVNLWKRLLERFYYFIKISKNRFLYMNLILPFVFIVILLNIALSLFLKPLYFEDIETGGMFKEIIEGKSKSNSIKLHFQYMPNRGNSYLINYFKTPEDLGEYKYFYFEVLMGCIPTHNNIIFQLLDSKRQIIYEQGYNASYGWNNVMLSIPEEDVQVNALVLTIIDANTKKSTDIIFRKSCFIKSKTPKLLLHYFLLQRKTICGILSSIYIFKSFCIDAFNWLFNFTSIHLKNIISAASALLLNLLVFLTAFQITQKWFRVNVISDFIQILFLLMIAQIIFTCTLLGMAARLFLPYLAGINMIIFGIAYFCLRKKPRIMLPNIRQEIENLFSRSGPLLCFIFCTIFVVYTANVVRGTAEPPHAYDALGYHLPFAAGWLKKGALYLYNIVFGSSIVNTYAPSNGDLVFLWTMIPFHDDFFVSTIVFIFIILSAISMFSIGKKLGISERCILWGIVLFLLVPKFAIETRQSHVDFMVTSLFLIALNCLLKCFAEKDVKMFYLSLVAFGLVIGIKYAAIGFALMLTPLFLYYIFGLNLKLEKSTRIIKLLFSIPLVIIVFGGYWYIRNWLLTGSFLYPAPLKIFGLTLMPGGMTDAFYTGFLKESTIFYSIVNWDFSFLPNFRSFPSIFGNQLWLMIGAALIVPIVCIFEKNKLDRKLLNIYVLLLPILTICIYCMLPASNWGAHAAPYRYGYTFFPLSCIALSYLINKSKIIKYLVIFIGSIFLLTSLGTIARFHPYEGIFNLPFRIYPCIGFSLLLFIFVYMWLKIRPKILLSTLSKRSIFGTILVLSILCVSSFQESYNSEKYNFYEKFGSHLGAPNKWINENTNGDNIAYVGLDRPYPLYGNKLKNNIFTISVNTTTDLDYHQYPEYDSSGLKDTRKNPNYQIWLQNLRRHKIIYIYIDTAGGGGNHVEIKWTQDNPNLFQLVYSDQTIKIYKLRLIKRQDKHLLSAL